MAISERLDAAARVTDVRSWAVAYGAWLAAGAMRCEAFNECSFILRCVIRLRDNIVFLVSNSAACEHRQTPSICG